MQDFMGIAEGGVRRASRGKGGRREERVGSEARGEEGETRRREGLARGFTHLQTLRSRANPGAPSRRSPSVHE